MATATMAITKEDRRFLEEIDKMEPKALCLRAQIACLIVRDGEILIKHCNDWLEDYDCSKIGCIRNIMHIPSGSKREVCYGLCAEQWALALATKQGISLEGATLYCTKHPCRICAGMIAVAGIKRIVYQEGYPDVLPHFDILKSQNIIVDQGPNTKYKSKKVPKSDTI